MLDGVDSDGTFLDVGCADLARRRCPQRDRPGLAEALEDWGVTVAGTATRPHRHEAVRRAVHWLDGEARQGRK